jgi:hypothetical protein
MCLTDSTYAVPASPLQDLIEYSEPHRRPEVLARAIEALRPLAEQIVTEGIGNPYRDWFSEICHFVEFDQNELWEGTLDDQVAAACDAFSYAFATGIAVGLLLKQHQGSAAAAFVNVE